MCLCPTKPCWFIPAKNLLAQLRIESLNLIISGAGTENSRNSNFNEPPIMKIAQHTDRERVVDILWKAFKNNKSVNYIAGEKQKKIRFLMQYAIMY